MAVQTDSWFVKGGEAQTMNFGPATSEPQIGSFGEGFFFKTAMGC